MTFSLMEKFPLKSLIFCPVTVGIFVSLMLSFKFYLYILVIGLIKSINLNSLFSLYRTFFPLEHNGFFFSECCSASALKTTSTSGLLALGPESQGLIHSHENVCLYFLCESKGFTLRVLVHF